MQDRQREAPAAPVGAGATTAPSAAAVVEVFKVFLQLGLTSFGGPIAHLAYFRTRFVERLGWMDDRAYADLVAFCQFLPGPASSQVGMAIGYRRGGLAGALAAFLGFTLPSVGIMVLAGYGVATFTDPVARGLLQGLKIAAVAVVGHAVWSMARSLCPDRKRAGFALAAAVWMLLVPAALSQVLVILVGALAGHVLLRAEGPAESARTEPLGRSAWWRVRIGLGLFFLLLALVPALAALVQNQALALFDAFYRSGALVFGGGHVVLPLLEREVVGPGWVGQDAFLAGYGIAQAVPGPLFTFAAFLGTVGSGPPNGLGGALLATLAIFLPAFLLVYGGLPVWERLRREPRLRAALMGTNAAVVGLLLAALYDPVWTSAIAGPAEFALALVAFFLLAVAQAPAYQVVLATALGGLLLPLLAGQGA